MFLNKMYIYIYIYTHTYIYIYISIHLSENRLQSYDLLNTNDSWNTFFPDKRAKCYAEFNKTTMLNQSYSFLLLKNICFRKKMVKQLQIYSYTVYFE